MGGQKNSKNVGHHLCTFPKCKVFLNFPRTLFRFSDFFFSEFALCTGWKRIVVGKTQTFDCIYQKLF